MKYVTLRLTMDQLVILDNALTALPYKVVISLINEINTQLKSQNEDTPVEEIETK